MSRAALYYRVSTADQTPQMQMDELRAYAEKRGFQVVGEYVETASGASRKRPELDRMLGDVRARKADVVLVWAFDRFARSTSHLVTTLEEFQALGVDFISYTQQIDTTTPAGKLTFSVLAAIAEFEREMIRERVKAGMAAAKARRQRIGRRRISMEKQSRVRRMREHGMTLREIAEAVGVSLGTAAAYARETA